jgi:hypothetical protein
MTYRPSIISLGAALPLLAASCGELGSDLDRPGALATVTGVIRSATATESPKKAVRVAIVWVSPGSQAVATTAAVTPEFPSRFRLTLDAPPPAAVMMGLDDGPPRPGAFGMALGAIAAFEDRNGNGQLDLASTGDRDFIDALAGVVENRLVFYSEGEAPPELVQEVGPVPRGFAIAVTGGKRGEFEGVLGFRPLSEEISLPLRDSTAVEWQFLMCKDLKASTTLATEDVTTATDLPATFPDPGDPDVRCEPDGSYVRDRCTVIRQETCGTRELDCAGTRYALPDPAHPPAGWPCPQRP